MHAYAVVDVFSSVPTRGNPVAVVFEADGLETETMQQIARWTNLSETTFVLKPSSASSDYRVRIFTPGGELPFAGHPSLGTAYALLSTGRLVPTGSHIVQECAAGLILMTVPRLSLRLPTPTLLPLIDDEADGVDGWRARLGVGTATLAPPWVVDVGPRWAVLAIRDRETLLQLTPDLTRLAAHDRRLGLTGWTLFPPHPESGPADIEVRSFAPAVGVGEDPVCGSGNGSVAVVRRHLGMIDAGARRYVAHQGGCVNRSGRVEVSFDDQDAIWIGGECVTTVTGQLQVN